MPPVFVLLILYFMPTIIGYYKGYDRMTDLMLVNLFLGWALYPWVILVWVVWAA